MTKTEFLEKLQSLPVEIAREAAFVLGEKTSGRKADVIDRIRSHLGDTTVSEELEQLVNQPRGERSEKAEEPTQMPPGEITQDDDSTEEEIFSQLTTQSRDELESLPGDERLNLTWLVANREGLRIVSELIFKDQFEHLSQLTDIVQELLEASVVDDTQRRTTKERLLKRLWRWLQNL